MKIHALTFIQAAIPAGEMNKNEVSGFEIKGEPICMRVCIPGDEKIYRNYGIAVQRAGGVPCFRALPESCDALILPGGGDLAPWRYGQINTASRAQDPARDALEWKLLEHFVSGKKPILGVCRGMQSINVFFGGDLVQDWPNHSAADGADCFHAVCTAPSILRTLYGARCVVNSSHHQIVGRLGSGLEALQWADDGAVEAIRHRDLPVWGVQWHPERTPEYGGCADGILLYKAFLSEKLS